MKDSAHLLALWYDEAAVLGNILQKPKLTELNCFGPFPMAIFVKVILFSGLLEALVGELPTFCPLFQLR